MMEVLLILMAFLLPLEFSATKTRRTLKIMQSLQNGTYESGTTVMMRCEIQNATSYRWLKDGQNLFLNEDDFVQRSKELVIISLNEQTTGVYECVGTDENGNLGRTAARIKLPDPWCIRPYDPYTACIHVDEWLCENIKSFPPKVDNLRVEIQVEGNVPAGQIPQVRLAITWDVPRIGRADLWGWQLTVLSPYTANSYKECDQYNREPKYFDSKEDMTEEFYTFIPPSKTSVTYRVEVKSIPYNNGTDAAKIEIKSPGECDLITNPRDREACCKLNIEGDMVTTRNSSVTLNWTSYFPRNLSITIDMFVIHWISENREVCDDGFITLNSQRSNYTILNLSNHCNFTIEIRAFFSSSMNLPCKHSMIKIFNYIPPTLTVGNVSSTTPEIPTPILAKAGFVIAAVLAGVVIASLIYILKKRNVKKYAHDALGMEIGRIFDYRITSSSFKKDFPPHGARLNTNSAWSSDVDNERQWIQIDLCKKKVLSGIATQGCKAADEWVTEYSVSYSNDGELYETYQINDIEEVFIGNRDRNSIVKNVFSPPITARYIRVQPKSWHNKISMRLELYGPSNIDPTGQVSVFILNPNHCDLCTDVVHSLAVLLMKTGRIHCEVDIFAPMNERSQGMLKFTEEKISICDYVIVPWMRRTHVSDGCTFEDVDTLNFLSGLDIIHAKLFRDRNKNKFILVCLDHCSLEVLPPQEINLLKYRIPSKIDTLVIELLGTTERQRDQQGRLVIEAKEYVDAKTKLTSAVRKNKKCYSK
ncbi:uncharacterized protein LOC124447328 [Xenia sp. Carnegie-2017]|uniref:uncharacterized protein LOC124447328 n=1 Tax=Xenia sp. Carnegie-2017 TaxID=2897299 RepID=UPI001F03DF78|nr:uncharacterized protein LOC124447328 [Xenia sp. Carnegie-2017]XP_046854192.1 uncharacterized protein LOC124447328 [Xenia sp. Carnegie-2017]XP_046854193.1 uncharacterized protein LOC124447328 [Xenia sp. Carnegie-2017]